MKYLHFISSHLVGKCGKNMEKGREIATEIILSASALQANNFENHHSVWGDKKMKEKPDLGKIR